MYAFDVACLRKMADESHRLTNLDAALVYEWKAHTRAIISCNYFTIGYDAAHVGSPREIVYTCSLDGTLKLWQLGATMHPSRMLGEVLSVGTFDAEEIIWTCIVLPGGQDPAISDPYSSLAVVGCDDGSVRAWVFDLHSYLREFEDDHPVEEIHCRSQRGSEQSGVEFMFGKILAKHSTSVIQLTSDGRSIIASGSSDGEIHLTNVLPLQSPQSNRLCRSFAVWDDLAQSVVDTSIDTHASHISGLRLLPDCLVSSSWDGTLKVWYGYKQYHTK
jgi:WD40 repeat protein